MPRYVCLLALLLLFGCSGSGVAKHTLKLVPPPPPARGWTKPTLGDIGFTIMLPEGWEADNIGERRKKGSSGPKDLSSAVLGGWSERDTGFMAMGSGDPNGKDALYMVIGMRSLKDPGTSVDHDISEMAASLKRFGVTVSGIKRTTVELPIGKAEKVQYKSKSDFFEDTTETFFVVDGDVHFEFTFSSMGSEDVALPGDAVMTTFRPDWMSSPGSDKSGK